MFETLSPDDFQGNVQHTLIKIARHLECAATYTAKALNSTEILEICQRRSIMYNFFAIQ